MIRPTRRLATASVAGLLAAFAVSGWIARGSSADAPPTKATPAPATKALPDVRGYALYKRGGKRLALALDWAGANRPPNVSANFGRDTTKHPMRPYHPHKLSNHKLVIYMQSHTDQDEFDWRAAGAGVVTVQATDDLGNPLVQPVTVVTIADGDDTPCDD